MEESVERSGDDVNLCFSCKGNKVKIKREKYEKKWKKVERPCRTCSGTGVIHRKLTKKRKKVVKSYPSFVAPGPYPVGDESSPLYALREDEELSYLIGNWKIFQKLGRHRYSTDDLVTSYFAMQEARALGYESPTMLDMGCGLGSVLLCNAWFFPESLCVGIEAQYDRYEQANRSISFNVGEFPVHQTRVRVLQGDLRVNDLLELQPTGFDVVTGTPPYFNPNLLGQPGCKETAACLFEVRGGVEEYCAAAARHLRRPPTSSNDMKVLPAASIPGEDTPHAGKFLPSMFFMVNTALASSRVYQGCAAAELSVVKRLDVIPRAGKPPLFCVFAIVSNDWLEYSAECFPALSPYRPEDLPNYAAGKPPSRVSGSFRGEAVETLVVRQEDSNHTQEYIEVLRALGKPSTADREKYDVTTVENASSIQQSRHNLEPDDSSHKIVQSSSTC
mmetsp:Transcript_12861/g.19338  ORF Transcript_12861/g.19338 Transcript_12861/m.19338 type:complete len:446 (-) Transcript_12861:147-1484(-)|eukprot:CAMPEP_0185021434 /NCGR_PEP_ID=MMETSP1103-20130426/4113_1 /TAXON_ID=36769 /ORGANISM="Paraphysomonas bandaiensis, Strain Caron Lab Isolate" /LENGTH=445 /DNA_ID=CAMNT_0027552953 /DNA_START=122 /DNA_END=1459 /DNA_ORIENTATION=-